MAIEKDCLLFDEKTGQKLVLDRQKTSMSMDHCSGIKLKRFYDAVKDLDVIKYTAIQGSSVTLLGLVKYDADNDVF